MIDFLRKRRHSWHPSSCSNAESESKWEKRRYSSVANIGLVNSKFSLRNRNGKCNSSFNTALYRKQFTLVNNVIPEELHDSKNETKQKTMKFGTAITGDHLTKLIALTLFVCITTGFAVLFSLYNIIHKSNW